MQRLTGVAITPGAAVGRAVLLVHRGQAVRFPIAPERVEEEVARLDASRDRSREQLEAIKARISRGPGSDLVPLFDAQLLMLDDPMIIGRAESLVRTELVNAEWAVQRVFEEVEEVFDAIEDPYLRERKGDVADVVGRLRLNLRQGARARDLLRHVEGPFVLIADELAPSMAAQIDWTRVRGFAMDAGSRTYHTAILARSLQVPAIVGLHDATRRVKAGAIVAIDGERGELVVDPAEDEIRDIAIRGRAHSAGAPGTPGAAPGPTVTRDGVRIRIEANVDLPDDVAVAKREGAEGVGLFRSEVLLGGEPLEQISEERQYEAYRQLVADMAPLPVTIRTFDLDEDRPERGEAPEGAKYFDRRRSPLGLRGIRLSLRETALFRRQLRAMLRASVHGTLRILLPFVSTVDELRAARSVIREAEQDLAAAGLSVPEIAVGVMIEVPSAALAADLLARTADFLAIGTNDLIQYTLAVDRTDERVNALYQPLNPGLLRLLRLVRRGAARAGTSVSVCGEMASDPAILAVLVGLGLTEFSMTPRAIPAARQLLSTVSAAELRAVVRRAQASGSVSQMEEALEKLVAGADPTRNAERGTRNSELTMNSESGVRK